LKVLCDKGEAVDLERIRTNFRTGYAEFSTSYIKYMEKQGEWEDIPYIVAAGKDNRMLFSLNAVEHFAFICSAQYTRKSVSRTLAPTGP